MEVEERETMRDVIAIGYLIAKTIYGGGYFSDPVATQNAAKHAYVVADAMLAARGE